MECFFLDGIILILVLNFFFYINVVNFLKFKLENEKGLENFDMNGLFSMFLFLGISMFMYLFESFFLLYFLVFGVMVFKFLLLLLLLFWLLIFMFKLELFVLLVFKSDFDFGFFLSLFLMVFGGSSFVDNVFFVFDVFFIFYFFGVLFVIDVVYENGNFGIFVFFLFFFLFGEIYIYFIKLVEFVV